MGEPTGATLLCVNCNGKLDGLARWLFKPNGGRSGPYCGPCAASMDVWEPYPATPISTTRERKCDACAGELGSTAYWRQENGVFPMAGPFCALCVVPAATLLVEHWRAATREDIIEDTRKYLDALCKRCGLNRFRCMCMDFREPNHG